MHTIPTVDEILAIDMLTLRDHTERAGDAFNASQHRERLRASMEVCAVCSVRRTGELAAYALLRPESKNCWFVSGLGTHPLHRTPVVLSELFYKIAELADRTGIVELKSNVYKMNSLSMAFHGKLGFQITRENEKAVEFSAPVLTIKGHPLIRRTLARRAVRDFPVSGN